MFYSGFAHEWIVSLSVFGLLGEQCCKDDSSRKKGPAVSLLPTDRNK